MNKQIVNKAATISSPTAAYKVAIMAITKIMPVKGPAFLLRIGHGIMARESVLFPDRNHGSYPRPSPDNGSSCNGDSNNVTYQISYLVHRITKASREFMRSHACSITHVCLLVNEIQCDRQTAIGNVIHEVHKHNTLLQKVCCSSNRITRDAEVNYSRPASIPQCSLQHFPILCKCVFFVISALRAPADSSSC